MRNRQGHPIAELRGAFISELAAMGWERGQQGKAMRKAPD